MTALKPTEPAPRPSPELLDLLATGDPPAFATDGEDRIVFWNRGAERALGRSADQVLGRRCYDVLGGRDVFGNLFCHEECAVVTMVRKGETVQGFEMVAAGAQGAKRVNVTILRIHGGRPDLYTLVHILQPIDESSRLARALEKAGAESLSGECLRLTLTRKVPAAPPPPPLTQREREILNCVAGGLQNKEIAQKLRISPATVRNHIHNVLEKLGIHSKLEAVSLAYREGWVESSSAPRS